jgi:cytochrome c oxidase subunit 3
MARAERSIVAEQFDDPEQQRSAATLGMWIFLVTEVMLFGGLFTSYTVYRWSYRAAFVEGSHHMDLVIGAVNTAVLLVSSLAMALAVQNAALGRRRALLGYLATTAALGAIFLVLKGIEYYEHAADGLVPGRLWQYHGRESRHVEMFFWLYYAMTGLHAVHLAVGVLLVSTLLGLAWRGRFSAAYHTPIEIVGLYWHLVDVIWVFLFPLFYLIRF